MKAHSIFLLTFSIFLAAPAFAAEPAPATTVEELRWAKLEEIHREAEQKISVNDFRGAVKLYEDAILMEPDDAAAYANMGRSYWILGDSARARDAFENALTIEPENEAALEGLRRMRDPDAPLPAPVSE